jgi:hypothetical protein
MQLEKLLEQQKRIAAQIEAAKAAQGRLRRLGTTLAKHPEILGVLSDREIVEALQSAAAAAAAAVSPQALGAAPAQPAALPGKGKEALALGGGDANSYT